MNDEAELDADIAGLLSREAARLDVVPEDVHARLAARLDGLGSSGAPPAAGGGVSALAKLAPVVAAFVLGGAIGAAVVLAVVPPKEKIVVVERPASSVVVPASSIATPSAAVPVEALPSVPRPVVSIAPVKSADTFVAERRVLDAARTALARGDAVAALASLAEHEKTYPAGALTEEREALYVRSLAEAGRVDDARTRAERFRARWPRSLLLPAVEAATSAH